MTSRELYLTTATALDEITEAPAVILSRASTARVSCPVAQPAWKRQAFATLPAKSATLTSVRPCGLVSY